MRSDFLLMGDVVFHDLSGQSSGTHSLAHSILVNLFVKVPPPISIVFVPDNSSRMFGLFTCLLNPIIGNIIGNFVNLPFLIKYKSCNVHFNYKCTLYTVHLCMAWVGG